MRPRDRPSWSHTSNVLSTHLAEILGRSRVEVFDYDQDLLKPGSGTFTARASSVNRLLKRMVTQGPMGAWWSLAVVFVARIAIPRGSVSYGAFTG